MTVVIAVAAFGLSLAGSRVALGWLRRRQVLDHPNERSSHKYPTPRGGGLAVTPAAMLCWSASAALMPGPMAGWAWVAVAGTLLLMMTSWTDDRHTMAVAPRLVAHAGVVLGAAIALPSHALVFQGWLPLPVDRLVAILGWLWFVNLYNFMDGIDGITGVETASLGFGVAIVATISGDAVGTVPFALVLAAAALGFLVWNWHPAKLFLGDSGSIPLGFLTGGLLIQLALAGQFAAALILPAYYLADATITICHRALRREKIWQAHRRHFYQRAVQGGRSHAQVSLAVLAGNLALIACAALAALGHSAAASLAAVVVVATLLGLLSRWAGK
jgi:UDP-N-acetylmuramyl pentapeptide phosphotransferase/UDP-N-acetylglucosamine-1-phosphate transferase